jgi:hypothetical protein
MQLYLTSLFATLSGVKNGTAKESTSSHNLKTRRSRLRRYYLSPEREEEINKIWQTFKQECKDIGDEELTSFPHISEYE